LFVRVKLRLGLVDSGHSLASHHVAVFEARNLAGRGVHSVER
jgi:hypothetical protein